MTGLAATGEFVSTTDPTSQALVAGMVIGTFVLLALERVHRVLVVLGAVSTIFMVSYFTRWKLISFEGAGRALDLNVLLLLASMMALVGVLKTTGVFPWAVQRLLERAGGRPGAIQRLIIWFTGILSSVADNVTTVIFVTPMATDMARRTGVPAAAYLLPMIMAANIGGTATLIGDPPNILIGSATGLSFMAFLANLAIPVLSMMVILEWMARRTFRSNLLMAEAPTAPTARATIVDPMLLRWGVGISLLVFIGFVTHGATGMPVAVPALIGAAALLIVQDSLYLRTHRPTASERAHGLLDVLDREIEWPTLAFFVFLFILVGAAVQTGLMDTVASALSQAIAQGQQRFGLSAPATLMLAALVICWASGILSSLIDNIPFVAVAIPIVARLSAELPGSGDTLWWALALGACLGGNGTAIGASANVTVVGIAERAGVPIRFAEFSRFGVPVAVMTLAISSLFLVGWVYLGEGPVRWLGLLLFGALFAAGRLASRRSATSTATPRS